MTKDELNKKLQLRKGKDHLHDNNIMHISHHDIDPSLIQPMKAVEKSMKSNAISAGLRNRTDVHTLHDKGILDKHHVMRGHAKTKDERLDEHLLMRPSKATLRQRNVLKSAHDSSRHGSVGKISGPSARLARSMVSDTIHKHIRKAAVGGTGKDKAISLGYVHAEHQKVDPSIHNMAKRLERNIVSDTIHKHIRTRKPKEEQPASIFQHADPMADDYESQLPRDWNGKMNLTACLDEVRHALFNIQRFRRYLDTLDGDD